MAVIKLFPSKDSTIYSLKPTMNTGMDAVIETSLAVGDPINNEPQASRILIQFDQNQIDNIFNTYAGPSQSISGSNGFFQMEIVNPPTYPLDFLILSSDGTTYTEITFITGSIINIDVQCPIYTGGDLYTWISGSLLNTLKSNAYVTSSWSVNNITAYTSASTYSISGNPGIILFSSGTLSPLNPLCQTVDHPGLDVFYIISSSYEGVNSEYYIPPYKANLKLYKAAFENLNQDIVLETFPIYDSWNMGTGQLLDSPEVNNGVSWIYRSYSGSNAWITGSYPIYVTGSFNNQPGGGTWYTASVGSSSLTQTQSFGYYDDKDINMDVSNIIAAWRNSTINNNGFIIKQKEEFINNINYQPKLKYFSRDTHTIYPPQLEIKWDDSTYNTGSSNVSIVDDLKITLNIENNPGFFNKESINKFRVYSRPLYPERIYQTSSLYIKNYYLPTSSFYAIKDLSTNEYIIDFDPIFTKLSADEQSNYFNIYMNWLEPERYYKILIKTIIGGSSLIFDNDYYFKIINGQQG